MGVLVLALETDLHADAVVDKIGSGARVHRIDPTRDERLPISMRISGPPWDGALEFADNVMRSQDVSGVFCRFAVDGLVPATDDPLKRFSELEGISAFLAILRLIPTELWMNDPWTEARANCRMLQAYVAHEEGMSVPLSIVTTQPEQLNAFAATHGQCVIKPISDAPLARVAAEFVAPERVRTSQFDTTYTAIFHPLSPQQLDQTSGVATLLQQRIPKVADVRVTVVDDQVYPAAMMVHDNPDGAVDFRLSGSVVVGPHDLPTDVARRLVRIVRRLGLRFASCDLILDKMGEYYFLEANVCGNWLWTEQGAGLQISQAIARSLIHSRREGCAYPSC